jgi:adenosylhomocysteine nucleosidase
VVPFRGMQPAAAQDDPVPKVAILICADAEWQATLEHIRPQATQASPCGDWFVSDVESGAGRQPAIFFRTGWGKVAAAAATQHVIDRWAPSLLLNLGTCGGLRGASEVGEVLLVERTVIYDIFEQMGDAAVAIAHYSTTIDLSWLSELERPRARRAALVSGDRDLGVEDVERLRREYGAVAGDWESGAIAYVARRNATRLLVLRVVTDLVGAQGGEAYGAYPLYVERTRQGMTRLLRDLPAWMTHAAAPDRYLMSS